ncbi:type II toxin-antitoxin system HicB family antitoxin [Mycobacterium sp.]|uniref:type II toxin-antitoxin system HicB family antitoxin n=1 Tax=Mycobacterium sp. TaxID=1785 RepID=UPI003C753758
MNHYAYRAEWSAEHREYIGRCIELSLVRGAPTMRQAMADIEQAVDEYLAECQEVDHEPPAPITDRKFSGKFVVRTSPSLHARLAVEAAEQNVSLNQWAVQKLAGRGPIGLFDL